jgi:hypothetical protein
MKNPWDAPQTKTLIEDSPEARTQEVAGKK